MLAHGCSQLVSSSVVAPSASTSSWFVEGVVTWTAWVEKAMAIVSGAVGTEIVLNRPLIPGNTSSTTDLAASVARRTVIEDIVVIDRASHVERMVSPSRPW